MLEVSATDGNTTGHVAKVITPKEIKNEQRVQNIWLNSFQTQSDLYSILHDFHIWFEVNL
jgi:hypothetical protein